MFFCAGVVTSTFGGGGGTKVFCSQALNATAAAATDTIRVAPARRRNKTTVFKFAGVRACLISVPRLRVVLKQAFSQKTAVRHPMKIATIRLRWNRKPKMMPPAKGSANINRVKKFS